MLINFFGKRGSGKTHTIKGQLDDENLRGPIVIVDILGNFDDPTYIQTTEISETILQIGHYFKLKNNGEDPERIIAIKPADPDLAIDYLSAALYEAGGGGTLVLDECDGFSFANAPCFDQMIRYGRNWNVDIITGCRRPAEISRNITAGANSMYIFQTQEPRDVDYFKNTILGERAEKLLTLPKYSGIYVDYDISEVGTFTVDKQGQIFKTNNETL